MIKNLLKKIYTYFHDALVIHIEDEQSTDEEMDNNVDEPISIINSNINLFLN